jgi:hypothetical protein
MRTVLSCRQGSETTTLKIDRSIPQDISGALDGFGKLWSRADIEVLV